MTFKSWSSAQSAPGKNNPGEGPKAAPDADKPDAQPVETPAQPVEAPAADEAKPAQNS